MGNVTDPAVDTLLTLWDDPTEYASISVIPHDDIIVFTIVIDAPECPRLEFPLPLPGGHA